MFCQSILRHGSRPGAASSSETLLRKQTVDLVLRILERMRQLDLTSGLAYGSMASYGIDTSALDSPYEELWDLCRVLLRTSPVLHFTQPQSSQDGLFDEESWIDLLSRTSQSGSPSAGERVQRLLQWKLSAFGASPSLASSSFSPIEQCLLVRAHSFSTASEALGVLSRARSLFGSLSDSLSDSLAIRLHHSAIHTAIVKLVVESRSQQEATRLIDSLAQLNDAFESAGASGASGAPSSAAQPPPGAVHYNYLLQALCLEDALVRKQKRNSVLPRSRLSTMSNADKDELSEHIFYFMRVVVAYMQRRGVIPDNVTFNYLASMSRIKTFVDAQLFLKAMADFDVMPNTTTFAKLLTHMDLAPAKMLMEEADRRGLQTDATLLVAWINQCRVRNKSQDAIEMLQWSQFKNHIFSPSHRADIRFILNAAASNPKYMDAAVDLLRDMARMNYVPNADSVRRLVNALCKAGRPKDAAEIVQRLGALSRDFLSFENRVSIVVGFRNLSNIKAAIQFTRDMEAMGLPVSRTSYCIIIESLVKHRRFEQAEAWMAQLTKSGFSMPIASFNLLLQGYLDVGRPQEADALVGRMKQWGLEPDQETYGCIITGLLKRNRIDEAKQIAEEVRQRQFSQDRQAARVRIQRQSIAWEQEEDGGDGGFVDELDELDEAGSLDGDGDAVDTTRAPTTGIPSNIHAIFLQYYISMRQWDEADRVWQQVVADAAGDVSRIADNLLAIHIHGLSVRGDIPSIEALESRGISWQSQPYSLRAMLSAYLRSDCVQRAQTILADTLKAMQQPDAKLMLDSTAKSIAAARAAKQARQRRGLGLPVYSQTNTPHSESAAGGQMPASVPNVPRALARIMADTVADFVSFFASQGNLAEAELYLEESLVHFRASSRPFISLIRSAVRTQNDLARSRGYWNEALRLGVMPDVKLYGTMMGAHVDAGDLRGALRLFSEFKQKGMMPSESMYNTLLGLYGRAGRVKDMEMLFRYLTRSEAGSSRVFFTPTIVTMNSLMTGYLYSSQYDKAMAIWRRMWRGTPAIVRRSQSLPSSASSSASSSGAPGAALPATTADADDDSDSVDKLLFSLFDSRLVVLHGQQKVTLSNVYGVSEATVSLALDTLGFAGRLADLEALWAELRDVGYPLSDNNFTSYMEALVRCGQIEKAVSVPTELAPQHLGSPPSVKMWRNLITMVGPNTPHGARALSVLETRYPAMVAEVRRLVGRGQSQLPVPVQPVNEDTAHTRTYPQAAGPGDPNAAGGVYSVGDTANLKKVGGRWVMPPLKTLLDFEDDIKALDDTRTLHQRHQQSLEYQHQPPAAAPAAAPAAEATTCMTATVAPPPFWKPQ
ncbi:hypothetical protein BC831DRAFT_548172 [Entophlyctis helioformis]|nr:hypothetical protein BC831DRAFT_548172 [Entophlyctis helioformis]